MADGLFGLNTGLDSASIIQKLVTLQRQPIDLVNAKKSVDTQKLNAFQNLKSRLQTFKSIVATLNTESRFLATKGTFSNNNSSATANAVDITTTSQATSGTFSFTINSLAKEGKVVSQGFAAITTAVPTGTLTINVGSTATRVTINSSNNTVDGLRLAINNSGADVKATFLDSGDPSAPIRLLISGTKTGAANAVSLQLTQPTLGGGDVSVAQFTQTQAAQNASLVMDGISVTKSSNTITDVLPGTVLNLHAAASGTITLSSDTASIKSKINGFVNGYNDVMAFLRQQLAVDATNNTTGTLFGSYSVQNLQQTLRDSITQSIPVLSGNFNYLSQIGITTQDDGTLTIDDGKLSDALANNIANVTQLFASKGTTTNANVTFIGFTEKTKAGTYDVRVSGGVPQLSPTGKSNFATATGSGNFFAGATGTDAEGLNFRISTSTDGSYGTITVGVGIAEILNRALANLTDASRNGPLVSDMNTLTKSIDDFDNTIIQQEARLQQFQDNLKAKFANLEVVVGKLNSQKQAFTSALQGVQSTAATSTAKASA